MTVVTLHPKLTFKFPVEAESISPDIFDGKSIDEIARLRIWEGNKKRILSDLFKIEQNPVPPQEETKIKIVGDVRKVRRIGTKMSMGSITIEGDVGMHLGEKMNGGRIIVSGNAGSWAGSQMKDGTIIIKGNAGDYIGAAYRGSTEGMNGGEIIIHGNARSEVGCFMKNGIIKVYGDIGRFAGIHMRNGTIFVRGQSEGRTGAQMVNGKIVVSGHIPSVLPTFTIDSVKASVKVNGEKIIGPFYRFLGDMAEHGKGKLFVSQRLNPHLSLYEIYL